MKRLALIVVSVGLIPFGGIISCAQEDEKGNETSHLGLIRN